MRQNRNGRNVRNNSALPTLEPLDFAMPQTVFKTKSPFANTGFDPVRQYMDEIARYPRITKEREQELGRAMAQCRLLFVAQLARVPKKALFFCCDNKPDQIHDAKKRWLHHRMKQTVDKLSAYAIQSGPLLHTQLHKLNRILRDYERLRNEFTQANLLLVAHIAQHYNAPGMTFLDFVFEGNIGLVKAAELYNPEFGHKFSTYATWWIKQAIKRAIPDQGLFIRYPSHMYERVLRKNRVVKDIVQAGLEVTPELVAKRMQISLARSKKVLSIVSQPVSLNRPVGADSDTELGDLLVDTSTQSLDLHVFQMQLRETLERVFKTLTPKEVAVLKLRFGFGGDDEQTLKQIGEKFHVTRERIRQIEAKALRKLRNPKRARALQAFAEVMRQMKHG